MHFDTAQINLIGDRRENQDRSEVLSGDGHVLAVVADGMGGHANGKLAAETAVAALTANLLLDDPPRFLADAMIAAHRAVFALGQGMPFEQRPGTTAVCALIVADKLWWTNIGDSRAYHLRQGRLLERTRDHTWIETQLAAGEMTPEEALLHPERHMIEHCLGIREKPPPVEVGAARTLAAGDVILLCSDGLWGQLDEADIIARLSTADPFTDTVRQLAEEAARAGRPHSDNVSVVAVQALPGKAPHS